MCGIFGVVAGSQQEDFPAADVGRAIQTLRHRGPDHQDTWILQGRCALAHARLAIIDLSPDSNQPFHSRDGRHVVVFNGEIFNYIELREQLQAAGVHFRTHGDTEVLLEAYRMWGPECVTRFNGDWAFAVYDTQTHDVFLSRDRYGAKPLLFAEHRGRLLFASELKAILAYEPALRQPNHTAIAAYVRGGLGAQSDESWIAGVRRLAPGHNMFWRQGRLRIARYWDYPIAEPTQDAGEGRTAAAVEEYRDLFDRAVRLRMRSDVPVGITLSSGIDSASIAATMRSLTDLPIRSFTAAFHEDEFEHREKASYYRGDLRSGESEVAARVAQDLGLDAAFVTVASDDILPLLNSTLYHLESGHSSPATLPLMKVLARARQDVTVVLEGQGADELLAGYVTHVLPFHLAEQVRRGHLIEAFRSVAQFRESYSVRYGIKLFVRQLEHERIARAYHRWTGLDAALGPALRDTPGQLVDVAPLPTCRDLVNRNLMQAHASGLVNLLHYGDALSMAHSVESRLPFLDVNLVEFCFRQPGGMKIHRATGKYLHRQAMAGRVPSYVLDERKKLGFTTPLARHFAKGTEAESILRAPRTVQRGVLDGAGVSGLLRDHQHGRRDLSTLLFRLLSVEAWHRVFIDDGPSKQ